MKYVYVLTSSQNDLYYEQFLLSAVSLRLHNPSCEVLVITDEKTKLNLRDKRAAYEKFVSEIKVIPVPSDFSQQEASRWLKTSLHRFVSKDFLFIDCDTVIAGDLSDIFSFEIQIGAVLDTHVPLDQHYLREHFLKEDKQAGFTSSVKTNIRFNGGLIFCKGDDRAHNFFEKWHSLWLEGRERGCTQDMPSLNQANFELQNSITELPGQWNCQIAYNGLPYLADAKMIHYFATTLTSYNTAFELASPRVLNSIKESGELSPDVQRYIENPKSVFSEKSRIISDDEALDVINSAYFPAMIAFRRMHKGLFFAVNRFLSAMKNPLKNLLSARSAKYRR